MGVWELLLLGLGLVLPVMVCRRLPPPAAGFSKAMDHRSYPNMVKVFPVPVCP